MDARGELRLTKHHGAGNDFLVLLDPDDRRPLSAPEARALCDRHRGLGADGVLRAVSGRGPAELAMELRNADGGVAEMSGNGIRCLVQAAVDGGMVGSGTVMVQTMGGLRSVEFRPGPEAGFGYGRVDMGPGRLGDEIGPDVLGEARWGQRVDMGNPHVVLFGAEPGDDTFSRVGPRWERSVEGGANVEFVWPGPGAGELTLRVWERGAGETQACGTGTCAVVAAAHAHGEVGTRVRVHNPGGPLDVELGESGISLAGPTQKVGDVTVDEVVLAALVDRLDAELDAGHVTSIRGATSGGAATEVATRQ